ncbi:MAG TPA: regulatory iron-sulfur-containing complex subunit RicT [Anaerolineales bacterium]|nr:regulatory iron-sulfur-containing complex subunit RicT [Anaerolineales bacterium]
MTTPFIVGIRFQKLGKTYHFDASKFREVKPGDFAVVDTRRGKQIGQVVQLVASPPPPPEGYWKAIQRVASPRDLLMREENHRKQVEVTIECRAKAAELKVPVEIKFVASEISFDGKFLSVLYSYEGEDKPDLFHMQEFLDKQYPDMKSEFRLIGPRDVAKILGGMGACGLETRCCSTFLTEFSPVSIKMAKAQGIALTPSEITGMCGRLRCCLIYEYEQYVEARKTLPKLNKRVVTPLGEGKVVNVLPLKQAIIVDVPEKGPTEFLKHEVEPWDELEALRRKAESPCDRHENGGCDCGKAENKTAAGRNVDEEVADKFQADESDLGDLDTEIGL